MATDAEHRNNFDRVLGLMLGAGWLKEFTFTDGKGFHLVWSVKGAERALELQKLGAIFGLVDEDDGAAVKEFTDTTYLGLLPGRTVFRPDQHRALVNLWQSSILTLGIGESYIDQYVLLIICDGWAPGATTKFVVK